MNKITKLFIVIFVLLTGCMQPQNDNNVIESNQSKQETEIETKGNSTKKRVYSKPWDENPLIIKEKTNNGNYEIVNEITDSTLVEKLIKALRSADWEENVDVDIKPEDYNFAWNSFKHGLWVNKGYKRLEVIIEGQSNYGVLSKETTKIAFEILTGKKFDGDK